MTSRPLIDRTSGIRSNNLRDLSDEFTRIRELIADLNLIYLDPALTGTTPGTVVKKIEVFDVNGVSLGFIAVYDAIP